MFNKNEVDTIGVDKRITVTHDEDTSYLAHPEAFYTIDGLPWSLMSDDLRFLSEGHLNGTLSMEDEAEYQHIKNKRFLLKDLRTNRKNESYTREESMDKLSRFVGLIGKGVE